MHDVFRFLRLPLPGLALKRRAWIVAFGAAGILVVAMWLLHSGWPGPFHATADMFVLPLALLAISLGLSGAFIGSLIVTFFLFWIGAEHLSAEIIGLRSANIAAITFAIAAFAHLQGHYQRRLLQVMTHDQGTRLPNRLALWHALDQQLRERQTGVPRNALLVITFDNLYDVAATFGYDAADHLMVQLWQHLVDAFAPGARVYHYRYERLAVLFHDPDDNPDALMRRLATRLETSVPYQDVPIHFTSLFGFVRLNGNDGRQVINQAEAAIETARERDLQGLTYISSMDRERKRGLILLGDLQTAKVEGSLTMHYQPKVRLSDMQLASFEALARWQHPTLGSISPNEFIPIVERTELIHSFSVWAVEHVFIAMREHWPQGQAQLPVAVNISSHNLMSPAFPVQIRALLDKYGLPPAFLSWRLPKARSCRTPSRPLRYLNSSPISRSSSLSTTSVLVTHRWPTCTDCLQP